MTTFHKDHLPAMADLFIHNFRKLRATIPILPDLMEDKTRVISKLERFFESCPGVIAWEGNRLIGYMGWYLVDNFRNTAWKGAYCPEWGHAASDIAKPDIYRAMYRVAARYWTDAGCHLHALSLLAGDEQTEKVWFWNGFGLIVVDAIRPMQPLERDTSPRFLIRHATLEDVAALHQMELEHAQYYQEPPILMDVYQPASVETLTAFLRESHNSSYLAVDDDACMGYLRFEVNNTDSVAIVSAPDQVANTGAYIRPRYRGQGVGSAVLNAALSDYAEQGFRRCTVNFESFNPEATPFWLKYFTPACISLMRVPERHTLPSAT